MTRPHLFCFVEHSDGALGAVLEKSHDTLYILGSVFIVATLNLIVRVCVDTFLTLLVDGTWMKISRQTMSRESSKAANLAQVHYRPSMLLPSLGSPARWEGEGVAS